MSTTSPVGSMILLPVTDPRKRGHVLRARDGFAKQDVRATQTVGIKFPGIAPAGLVLAKRRVVETRDTHRDVPCSRIDRTVISRTSCTSFTLLE